MAYCCSQCSFKAQFESALSMHHQLHHEAHDWDFKTIKGTEVKSNTIPLERVYNSKDIGNKSLGRTSSATRLFEKLRARICRSKTLFPHPEEGNNLNVVNFDLSAQSECTSKAMQGLPSCCSGVSDGINESRKEIFSCHLCSFDADRITVLDRHLLNDHKIGLENLLKLVMAKTKDGLSDEKPAQMYGIRQPYYRPPDDIIENGEFIIETVTPKIKILKHAAVNTDLKYADIPDLTDNCKVISREIEKLFEVPLENTDKDAFYVKMQTLNECMCKFVDSSNTLKRVLTKEFVQKKNMDRTNNEPFFELGLGDRESPRDWERAHSEKLERNRSKHPETRSDRLKLSSDSFYF
ncbi:uncharacterized protein LOC119836364 [Zerene cesonia]|uniref:uncharacterized protein LOC119836364 n=1 Tax=Zerene cesonia TaxID=33412 RepID=UPI0018E53584|nr:uncharacterized protein LOC119836364 [Zerene cesonia]